MGLKYLTYDGGLLGTRGVGRVDPSVPNYLDEVTRRPGRQFITAGGKDQQVLDGGPGGYSFFTYYFLRALEEGLGDTNKDGYVTFSELTAFLVPSATNPYQTPTSGSMAGHQLGEFVFRFPEGERSGAPIASGSGGYSRSEEAIAVVNAPNASIASQDKDVDLIGIVSIKATEDGLDTPQSPRVFKQRFIASNIEVIDPKRGGKAGTVLEIVGSTSCCSRLAALGAYACMVQLGVDATSKTDE